MEPNHRGANVVCTRKGGGNQSFAYPLTAMLGSDHEHANNRPIVGENSIPGSAWTDMHYRPHDRFALGNDQVGATCKVRHTPNSVAKACPVVVIMLVLSKCRQRDLIDTVAV